MCKVSHFVFFAPFHSTYVQSALSLTSHMLGRVVTLASGLEASFKNYSLGLEIY
jgi:hypothetical protein